MATYYLDTNALIKLYVFDAASYWTIGVEAHRSPRNRIVVSEVVRVEVPSALYKVERIDRNVDADAIDLSVRRLKRQLGAEMGYRNSRFVVALLNDIVFNQADVLLANYRAGRPTALHSLDALHLTSAVVARGTLDEKIRAEMVFVSADKQLRGCAQNEGFRVVDPNSPPRP